MENERNGVRDETRCQGREGRHEGEHGLRQLFRSRRARGTRARGDAQRDAPYNATIVAYLSGGCVFASSTHSFRSAMNWSTTGTVSRYNRSCGAARTHTDQGQPNSQCVNE